MSCDEFKCNHPNNKISESEWTVIEANCRKQGHLSESELLINRIELDEENVLNHGITFENLDNFFEEIKYKNRNPFRELSQFEIDSFKKLN